MDDEQDQSEDIGDYRRDPELEIRKLATKERNDLSTIVQPPVREEVEDEDSPVEVVETMGLSVSPAARGTVTIQNTSVGSHLTERFVAFDVEIIDDIIDALEDVKEECQDPDEFSCPCCSFEGDYPDDLDEDEYGYVCPECDYLL